MPDEVKKLFSEPKAILSILILPLLAGIILAAFIPRPKIGIIRIEEAIDSYTGEAIVEQIRYAYQQADIHAVVLVMDCPGGTISDTELVYLELNRLREKKPVVTMIQGLSASGGYYLAMASDFILSNPSATVGNIGVISTLPSSPEIYEEIYSTGPYKLWGSPRDAYVRQMDVMKASFLQAVLLGRAEKLTISQERILRGEVYPASEAMQYGLIDALGARSDAYKKAAEIARIAHYEVVDLGNFVEIEQDESENFFALDGSGQLTGYPREAGFYYLYIAEAKGELQ
jgi:protease-4